MSPMSTDRFNLIPNIGNTNHNKRWVIDLSELLPLDTIYWSVQAVDNSFLGGKWAEEKVFVIPKIRTDFYANTVCLNHATNFTDSTIISEGDITSWKWYFGDGDSSFVQNPSHTYAESGIYYVQLTASSDESSHSVTKPVICQHIPYPYFTANIVCQGGMTTFTIYRKQIVLISLNGIGILEMAALQLTCNQLMDT